MLRQLQFLNDLEQKQIDFGKVKQLLEIPNSANALYLEKILEQHYQAYLKELLSLPFDVCWNYLKVQMEEELVTTQRMENEKSFLIRMYMKTMARNPILFAREQFNQPMTLQAIQQIHNELMLGTSQDGKNNYELRTEEKVVAHYKVGQIMKVIYNPPLPSEIKACMEAILPIFHFYASNNYFLNAFRIHALVGIIQPFQDGNSRLARILQYGYLSKITEQFITSSRMHPTFYYTEGYAKDPVHYRELIGQIALQGNVSSLDTWYAYNADVMLGELRKKKREIKQLRKIGK